jgi:hypothetical protein
LAGGWPKGQPEESHAIFRSTALLLLYWRGDIYEICRNLSDTHGAFGHRGWRHPWLHEAAKRHLALTLPRSVKT